MDLFDDQIGSLGRMSAVVKKMNDESSQAMARAAYEKSAEHAFDVIAGQIKHVESTLAADQEVLLMFASFGQTVTMAVDKIGYKEPHFIFFAGKDGEHPAYLVQHMSQLSFLALVEKIESPRPARRIGFYCDPPQEE